MANSIFNMFGNQPQQNTPFGNMANMMQQFQQFKNGFSGDPKAMVQQLLNSGRMTQEQFNQLAQTAQYLRNMMGGQR